MTLAGRVGQAYDEWTSHNTGWMIDGLVLSYYTAKGAPSHEITVVVGVDSDLNVEGELRELRARIHTVCRSSLNKPVSIVVRTLDSGIIVNQ